MTGVCLFPAPVSWMFSLSLAVDNIFPPIGKWEKYSDWPLGNSTPIVHLIVLGPTFIELDKHYVWEIVPLGCWDNDGQYQLSAENTLSIVISTRLVEWMTAMSRSSDQVVWPYRRQKWAWTLMEVGVNIRVKELALSFFYWEVTGVRNHSIVFKYNLISHY